MLSRGGVADIMPSMRHYILYCYYMHIVANASSSGTIHGRGYRQRLAGGMRRRRRKKK